MIGTIVNTLAILIGGGFGCIFTGKLAPRIQRLLLQCIGLVALFLGARSFIGGWFDSFAESVETKGTLLVIFALLIGALFGEALRLDKLMDKLGKAFSSLYGQDAEDASSDQSSAKGQASPARKDAIRQAKKAARHGAPPTVPDKESGGRMRWWEISKYPTYPTVETRSGSRFVDGFVWATLLCALSGMCFSGAIAAGLSSEPKELFIKAAIDGVLVFFLASIYGMGATFGAAPVLVVESLMIFISNQWASLMTDTLIAHLTVIAAVISIGAGICLCFGKKWRVMNLVPALLISPIYGLIVKLAEGAIEK